MDALYSNHQWPLELKGQHQLTDILLARVDDLKREQTG
jgi:hypothetical protein